MMYKSIRRSEVLNQKVQKLLKITQSPGGVSKPWGLCSLYEFNFGYLRNYVKQAYITSSN